MQTIALNPRTRDITFVGGSPGLISGKQKLEQDLRAIIVEKLNSDPYTNGYGSNIYEMIPDMNGMDFHAAEATIVMEVMDTITRFQMIQLRSLDGIRRAPWTTDQSFAVELAENRSQFIERVDSIKVQWNETDLRWANVVVTVVTQDNDTVVIDNITLSLR